MSNLFEPIVTANLDWSSGLPFSLQFNDIYHASESAIEQSRYVFIDGNNLIRRWQELPQNDPGIFTIAETGFGTGLNFLLTWLLWEEYAPESACLHYFSCEKHPLKLADLIRCLNNWPELSFYAQQLIDRYPILTPGHHQISFANGRIKLTLMLGDALECFEQFLICGDSSLEDKLRAGFIDAWYLDGFAPKRNEHMWSEELISIIALLSKEQTTLATYTAAAPVKARLRARGFVLEKKKGFGPKRHMLCAHFKKSAGIHLKKRATPWHSAIPIRADRKAAIIVGAGLAGCFTANSLAKRGWTVTLIDELQQAGCSGSANQQAVLFPKLSAYKSPLTQFMLTAFLFASGYYRELLQQFDIGRLNGSLLLAHNQKEEMAQQSLVDWLSCYPELGVLVDKNEASDLSGVKLDKSGLYIPLSGWLNSPDLCRVLIDKERISLVANTPVDSIFYNGAEWEVNDKKAPVLILANGNKVHHFKETEYLPVKSIRGQMSSIPATAHSSQLKIPLCADGHVLPEKDGRHRFGATYDLGNAGADIKAEDDWANHSKLVQMTDAPLWSDRLLESWAGVRATTPDYLPLVGPVAKAGEFMMAYSGLRSNAKRWIPGIAPYYPGLYVCAGFGSRGLTTTPLCGEWLASLISGEQSCLPRNLIQALSPARFLRKKIVKGME
ncbi:bifunctional tRNA (5-methylaminomethyl-2-thiouridine)(34)-methyltransferase MnmD/FAD-dependent 5-carboxymethylaminomethyl-2-thiouridine(34) oxidoreductase MnmC [Legionella shakespearei]|uniref:tRNA 5-methylaminomethyl-2-thiouridine biosynthesis bifunctional protein MnmC n=1 Tax=Legionella shakespearei DSM 23087 TaxID=1122169 RepID=A0A0W0Z1W7_9GAMM|nr:bifunctional tRNA (5-methylaminomethyl-2-thiouridine)(34)-methyltransferase MnmD/FAD-dependent 5-carboxymethylaminomethyl-2-thiouridine(34) oxidoreductase MnmC [Legionella shakespearei]KTD62726.1 FAD-dependent cmnm(5)s(2)U34 oxidoreductase [Legionella shakespearei DSM 23087]